MDGLMIAFLLGTMVMAEKKNILSGSILMAVSILSKMLTLILIPFLPKHLYWRQMMMISALTISITALAFLFSFGNHTGWLQSVSLWFQSFEFNAGLYYLLRELGYTVAGYNMINLIGPILACITLLGIVILWWIYYRTNRLNSMSAMLYVLTLFFLMSTTVHPWYLVILVTFSVVTRHVYPVVWSYLVFLSYSHYHAGAFMEDYYLIATEYGVLSICMFWEWRSHKK
jgi:hypothetical protein